MNVQGTQDECPVCLELFDDEHLADTYCSVLPCRHASCMPCLVTMVHGSRTGSDHDAQDSSSKTIATECPVCRVSHRLETNLHQRVLYDLYELLWNNNHATGTISSPHDNKVTMHMLQGVSSQDKFDIFDRLMTKNKYNFGKVQQALEDMIVCSTFQQRQRQQQHQQRKHQIVDYERKEPLTPDEKHAIFVETQRPVLYIRTELFDARGALREARNFQEYDEARQLVANLEKQLVEAIRNAREDIYSQMNSRGGMGGIVSSNNNSKSSSSSIIQVDYHGLHRDSALQKFDELVVPTLPILGCIEIITGKGKHNRWGVSVLQEAPKLHIDEHDDPCIRWEPVSDNEGVIRVVHSQDTKKQR